MVVPVMLELYKKDSYNDRGLTFKKITWMVNQNVMFWRDEKNNSLEDFFWYRALLMR